MWRNSYRSSRSKFETQPWPSKEEAGARARAFIEQVRAERGAWGQSLEWLGCRHEAA